MATTNNIFYLGQDGAEQLVANVKNLIGDYALKDETEAALGETVKFTAQSLTDEQKAQARENIGIVEGVSSWNDLTDKPFDSMVVDPVFDGDMTGRETVLADADTGAYAVKITHQVVSADELVGSTLTLDMGGTEQTIVLTNEMVMDASLVLGASGAVVLQGTDPIVLSLPNDSAIQGAFFAAGTWFMCIPGAFYVKSVSCLYPSEYVTKKLDAEIIDAEWMAAPSKTIVANGYATFNYNSGMWNNINIDGAITMPYSAVSFGSYYDFYVGEKKYSAKCLDPSKLDPEIVELGFVASFADEAAMSNQAGFYAHLTEAGNLYIYCPTETIGRLPVRVIGKGNITPLPMKFLPEGYPYAEDGETILEETSLTANENGEMFLETDITLEAGNKYTIVYNGAEYVCEAVDGALPDEPGAIVLGNYNLATGTGDTGEPFIFAYAQGYGCMVVDWTGATSCTLAIKSSGTIHKLDMKYLPEGYPYVEPGVKIDPTFNGDLTGREYIISGQGYYVKVSPQYLTVDDIIGATIVCENMGGEQLPSPITESYVKDRFDAYGFAVTMVETTNYAPVISVPATSTIGEFTFTAGTWFLYKENGFTVKSLSCLEAYDGEEIVHKIDPKYLPDNIGGAWTCVEIPSRGDVIFEDYNYIPGLSSSLTSIEAPAAMWTTADASAPAFPGLEIGKTYVVNWCGADYVTTCVNDVTSWGPCVAIGSKTLTEEMPFYIAWQDFEGEKLTTVIGLNFANFDDLNYTVGLYDVGDETTFNRLPDACLPVTAVRKAEALSAMTAFYDEQCARWIDEDGKLDKEYIPATWLANLKQGDVVLTPETTVTSIPTSGVRITDKCNLNAFQYDPAKPYVTIGTPAVVNYDGTVYNLTLKKNVIIQSYIGNLALYNSAKENTGESFCLFIKHKSGTKEIEYVTLYTDDTENTDHTISVTVTTFVPDTMPEEYLPESVATKEYVNIRVPAWTDADEGKFLRIVNGTPTWVSIPYATEGEY